jgi:hypothetical protein
MPATPHYSSTGSKSPTLNITHLCLMEAIPKANRIMIAAFVLLERRALPFGLCIPLQITNR